MCVFQQMRNDYGIKVTKHQSLTCNNHCYTDCNYPEQSNSPDKSHKRKELVTLHPSKPEQISKHKLVRRHLWSPAPVHRFTPNSCVFVTLTVLKLRRGLTVYSPEDPPTWWGLGTGRRLGRPWLLGEWVHGPATPAASDTGRWLWSTPPGKAGQR